MSYLETLKHPAEQVPAAVERTADRIALALGIRLYGYGLFNPNGTAIESTEPKPDSWMPAATVEDVIGVMRNNDRRLFNAVSVLAHPTAAPVTYVPPLEMDKDESDNVKAFYAALCKKRFNYMLEGLAPETEISGRIIQILRVHYKDEAVCNAVDITNMPIVAEFWNLKDDEPFSLHFRFEVNAINEKLDIDDHLNRTAEIEAIIKEELELIKKS